MNSMRGIPPIRAKHLYRKRGYSLVEMALALAVLGLVIGGALFPLNARFEKLEIENAEQHLADAREAVLGYALQHKTRRRDLEYHGSSPYVIPSGRPYLPCPDITGDGIEDRQPTRTYSNGDIDAATTRVEEGDFVDGLGLCEEHKGMLPWRTLGLKQYDPWGTHLTYRVDRAYADYVLGFDETNFADIFDTRKEPETIAFGSTTRTVLGTRDTRDDAGAVICRAFDGGGACPAGNLGNLVAGIITRETVNLPLRRIRSYNAASANIEDAGIVDGAVFVIVSHGRNGYGGVGQNGNCRYLPTPTATGNIAEQTNAYYSTAHDFYTFNNCKSADNIPAGTIVAENMFVQDPITEGGADDMLTWVSANELMGVLLTGGALPVRRLEFLDELDR